MQYHYIILIGIIALFGFLGGSINYLSKSKPDDHNIDRREFRKSVITGIGASFLVPLFLNMISSDLISESINDPYKLLVIAGFCLIASISAKPFIDSMSDKIIKQIQEDNKELRREVNAVAKEVDSVVGSQTELEESESENETTARLNREMQDIENRERLQRLKIYDKDDDEVRVIKALGNGEYKYRTESGITKGTYIDTTKLSDILDELIKRNYIGSIVKENRKLYYLTTMGRALLYEKNKYVEGEIIEIIETDKKNSKYVYKFVLNNNNCLFVYSTEKALPYGKGDRIYATTVDGKNVDIAYVKELI